MNNHQSVVSVVMITYGHEKYIEEAINGVFIQQTDFPVELIIANDCSPDNTDEFVKKLLLKKPSNVIVKYIHHESNVGMVENFVGALQQAHGKYIAICEGDDYWTDPLKLQKQVDFLERNNDYVLCFTNRNILKNDILEYSNPLFDKSSFTKTEIPFIHVPTLTVVFRNVVKQVPSPMQKAMIDASLFLFLSQFGSFYYLDEQSAVYRVHGEGMWSGNSELRNYRRSVNTRLVAWKYLKNVDKISLANVLLHWISLAKYEELKNKKYLWAARSIFLEYFFNIYIWRHTPFLKKN